MRLRRALAPLGAVAALAVAACDVPFAPKWDADMYIPLSTQAIHLDAVFTLGTIPPATSDTASFPPQQQDVTGPIHDVLKNVETDLAKCQSTVNPALTCHVLALTITKTTPVSAQDTIFVSPDSLGLFATRPGGIVFPVLVLATDQTKTDSMFLSAAQIGMLQNAADSDQPLWVQLRGQVTNPSASPVTLTAADSIGVKLSATLRVRISHH
jgi:hypothetical protein